MRILFWLLLLVICWPLAIVLAILYPIAWLLLLPFRIVGITMEGLVGIVRALFFLPARILGFSPRR